MKKIVCIAFMLLSIVALFGGGIVTNTNQHATYIRMPARAATLEIDGVYYNPAGLVSLEDGFHFSLNNQYIAQTRIVKSTNPTLHDGKFKGEVLVPIFPDIYAAYKKGKMTYSFGVCPIGGGGSADFDKGLPSFEEQVSALPAMLTASGITTTDYDLSSSFEGRSLNWGLQFNFSYAISEMIGVSVGCRYVIATNTYEGNLKDIMINPQHASNPNGSGNMVSAPLFFETLSTNANNAAQAMQPIITGGGGGYTLDELVAFGMLTEEQANQLSASLGGIYNSEMTAEEVQTAYYTAAATMDGYAAGTSDKELEVTQNGTGISPIFGVNFNLNEKLNIALKYEHKTVIEMENDTKVDDVSMFPDKAKNPNDMPGLLTLGVGYRALEKLYLSTGMHYYFDKDAEYRKKNNGDMIDEDSWEASLGLEYQITDKIMASIGYIRSSIGVSDDYQSDITHALSSSSYAFGGRYYINDKLNVDFGVINTFYDDYDKDIYTFERDSIDIALGLNFKL
ncbi:MAG TPA: aromatic hydrocarbon degradation protein [Candidatus Cloacimonadota bacterium]|nr:aromatic hydrocarbon degradation protein [Candidatus Cloacimonadota bacterium]